MEIRHDGLTEWYSHVPAGLEQGFGIERRPDGMGELIILVGFRGDLHSMPIDRGSAVELRDASGTPRAVYRELRAWDALGAPLAATMDVVGSTLRLAVADAGARYPLTIDPLIAVEEAKLIASDGGARDSLGIDVAVSGDTALVGAYIDEAGRGSAYVFMRSGSTWAEQAKLTAGDGTTADFFGGAVALDEDTALVGAWGDDDHGDDSGSAYILVRSGTSWTEQAKLVAADGSAGDMFGYAVALDGDTALVGAREDDDHGTGSGSAYIFVRSGTRWSQQAKLTAPDGAAEDLLGYSVALVDDTALIGAHGDDDLGSLSGSAYVFVRSGSTWTEQAKLTASEGIPDDRFGYSVALAGDTAFVGARYGGERGVRSGSVYVFVRSGTSWSEQGELIPADGSSEGGFGVVVAVSGNLALIGAPYDDDLGTASGSAFLFARAGSVWEEQSKLLPSDGGGDGFNFGYAVSLSNDVALIGQPGDDARGTESGSAYVFRVGLGSGSRCPDTRPCASGYCVDGVCCDGACGGGAVDDCQACSIAGGGAADGTCGPLVATVAPTVTCRPAGGICDLPDSCIPDSTSCPTDLYRPSTDVCRTASCTDGVQTAAATCAGSSAECPSVVTTACDSYTFGLYEVLSP